MAGGLFPPNGAYPVNGGLLTQVAEVVLVVVVMSTQGKGKIGT
jgi:hypothetical protein